MPPPFRALTRNQFAAAVSNHDWLAPKSEIHVHHTWRPNHAQYRGIHSIRGMYEYHMKQGWGDIAQHISIAPDGTIWTGRPWNARPASAAGHNHAGVFMFETIGDFDVGKDPLTGEQLESVLFVLGTLQIWFGLPLWSSIRFHNQMSGKTCPGSSIDRAWLIGRVKEMREKLEKNQSSLFGGPIGLFSTEIAAAIDGVDPLGDDPATLTHEHNHGGELETFMDQYHRNPFLTAGGSGAGAAIRTAGVGSKPAVAAVRKLTMPTKGTNDLDAEAELFEELGRRAQIIEANPEAAGELVLTFGPSISGFTDGLVELGRRIFRRLEREFHALLCGEAAADASDRAKLRDAFGLGADATIAAIVGVLTGGLGVAPAIATVVAALLVRRVLQPTYQETCVVWSEKLSDA